MFFLTCEVRENLRDVKIIYGLKDRGWMKNNYSTPWVSPLNLYYHYNIQDSDWNENDLTPSW